MSNMGNTHQSNSKTSKSQLKKTQLMEKPLKTNESLDSWEIRYQLK